MRSRPGMQKQRRRASMPSSLPTPTKRLAGVSFLAVWACVVRRSMRSCFSACWCGSGYRCRPSRLRPGTETKPEPEPEPEPGSESVVSFMGIGSEGPKAFSLASNRMLVPSSL